MRLKEFYIELDIKKQTSPKKIDVVQGDVETNILNISITDELKTYVIEDASLEVVFLKPIQEVIIQTDYIIKGNQIILTVSDDVISEPGLILSEVRVLGDNIVLTTERFKINVRESIYKVVV